MGSAVVVDPVLRLLRRLSAVSVNFALVVDIGDCVRGDAGDCGRARDSLLEVRVCGAMLVSRGGGTTCDIRRGVADNAPVVASAACT